MSGPRGARLALGVTVLLAACRGAPGPVEQVTIPPGSSFGVVTDSLAAHHVIEHPKWFRLLARVRGVDSLGMTRLHLLALASIIEGEARVDSERPIISAVYWNRIKKGMPLQADPTVQYAILMATGSRKNRLLLKDYSFRSPYNTYLNTGLPPGPVNSPGRASIEAALYPAMVPYLFFVAAGDGHHVFTRTYGEHLRAIARIRRARGPTMADSAM